MFWNLGADSSPFRNIDFQPEVFYLSPSVSLAGTTTLSGQVGLRHISNGRAGDSSRSLNTVYFSPMAAFSLGDDRRLIIAPRAWFYAGDLSDNPDIRRYRGNTELFVQIGEEEGLRLSTTTRISLSSGKSSFAADLSYPLRRIISGAPDISSVRASWGTARTCWTTTSTPPGSASASPWFAEAERNAR